jgi:hypothetical protein
MQVETIGDSWMGVTNLVEDQARESAPLCRAPPCPLLLPISAGGTELPCPEPVCTDGWGACIVNWGLWGRGGAAYGPRSTSGEIRSRCSPGGGGDAHRPHQPLAGPRPPARRVPLRACCSWRGRQAGSAVLSLRRYGWACARMLLWTLRVCRREILWVRVQ